ncbi:MAG: sigma-70 family RNA polymerase sigma factor [Planctomycetota bacterium]|nr:sigma-70 family RNA polymerase sigma factor [Planctomycetota bacterium]
MLILIEIASKLRGASSLSVECAVNRMDDKEIIERVLSGERETFRYIVERYWRKVMAVVRQRISAPEEVEEVVQNVFLRVYQKLNQLRDASFFSYWLYQIAQKCSVDYLRRGVHRPYASSEEVNAMLDRKEAERKEEDDVRVEVRDAVDSLPPRYREVVMLRFVGGMSCNEIAEYLGEPSGTVRNRLFRANKMLKLKLRHLFKGGE